MTLSIPIITTDDVETFLPGTEITVKVPRGTTGFIVEELTKQIALVQFDLPSLGAVRVDRRYLKSGESLDTLLRDMQAILDTKPIGAKQVQVRFTLILFKTLRLLADDTNKDKVERIITTYEQVLMPRRKK